MRPIKRSSFLPSFPPADLISDEPIPVRLALAHARADKTMDDMPIAVGLLNPRDKTPFTLTSKLTSVVPLSLTLYDLSAAAEHRVFDLVLSIAAMPSWLSQVSYDLEVTVLSSALTNFQV